WRSPVTNKLLLEAGVARNLFHYPGVMHRNGENIFNPTQEMLDTVSILESSTNFRYNASGASFVPKTRTTDRDAERFSASYVTGSHNFKFGFQDEQARIRREDVIAGGATSYVFNKGVPSQVLLYAQPSVGNIDQTHEIGLYVQDQW